MSIRDGVVENIGFEPMSLACKASAKTNSAKSPLKIVYDVHIFHHKKNTTSQVVNLTLRCLQQVHLTSIFVEE